ncbi:MAG: SUF system NifU family Fe-S cluster assembly protein [Rhodanobacter sp.]|jgi:nitrogen fixation NifU-like protein|nr:SUF system NifU family Fe-S cluster assembly protein [Rhodanobacter sp.]
MSASPLYQQLVLDHYRHPRNRGGLAQHTHAADGANPLCGDALRVEVRCVDGRIEAMRFSGEACAIATATASMLSEWVADRPSAALADFAQRFERLIADGTDDSAFGPLLTLRELQRYPSRRKCALLPWATLHAALTGVARATTETESA